MNTCFGVLMPKDHEHEDRSSWTSQVPSRFKDFICAGVRSEGGSNNGVNREGRFDEANSSSVVQSGEPNRELVVQLPSCGHRATACGELLDGYTYLHTVYRD